MQTKFKIGDKVKVLTKAYPLVYNMEGVVTKVAEGGVYQVERVVENQPSDQYGYFGNDCWRFAFYDRELELVEDKPKTKFSVGDKVLLGGYLAEVVSVKQYDTTTLIGVKQGNYFFMVGPEDLQPYKQDEADAVVENMQKMHQDLKESFEDLLPKEPAYVIGQEVYIAAGITRNLKPAVIIDAVVRNGLLKVSVGGFDCYVEEERVYTRVEVKGN